MTPEKLIAEYRRKIGGLEWSIALWSEELSLLKNNDSVDDHYNSLKLLSKLETFETMRTAYTQFIKDLKDLDKN